MLDTDVSSYVIKRSSKAVLKRLGRIAPEDVCVSSITKAELLYGVEVSPHRAKDSAAVDAFLRYVMALDFPEGTALDYARTRARLKRRGEMIGANELLIAAHAQFLGLILVTSNTREFQRITGLKIENWAE